MTDVVIVCMNSTDEKSGGGSAALQNSLCFYERFRGERIHYFGLASSFWREHAWHYYEVRRDRLDDVQSRLLLRTNFLCLHIDAFLRAAGCRFDVAMLGNSRLGYVAKALRSRTRFLITCYANIEVDYIRHKYGMPLVGRLDQALFAFRERQCARLSDLAFFLTARDQRRHAELYGPSPHRLLPIATRERTINKESGLCLRLGFLGSLSYRPNVRAVRSIITQLLPRTDLRLLLAGSDPCDEIRALVRAHQDRIDFHPNFATLDGILRDHDVFLSPLREGAGMKVKVADCIAMGAPILGSPETFVGYEALPHLDFLVCDEISDYLDRLERLKNADEYASVARDLRAAFRAHFSMDAAIGAFASACGDLATSNFVS